MIPLFGAPCCYAVAVDGETQVGMDPKGLGREGGRDRRSGVSRTRYTPVTLLPLVLVLHPLSEPAGGQVLALLQARPARQAERVHLGVPGDKGQGFLSRSEAWRPLQDSGLQHQDGIYSLVHVAHWNRGPVCGGTCVVLKQRSDLFPEINLKRRHEGAALVMIPNPGRNL